MLGTIGFKGYRVSCIIGTEPHERNEVQDLLIDLKVELDFSQVFQSGDLKDTIDYRLLVEVCQNLAVEGNYGVLEKYASDVIEEIFTRFSVKSAWISIRKPLAIPGAECALIELKQDRQP